ncbi:hypothetical protein MCOR02_007240 [Pyricularia oryzae]|nr:hypothetical protein MCOR02_007240 [Pyricularia oryzae]KAI6319382.1 hypothetical protein MCOR34_003248 [Pyricularia oryzae]KAI6476810.1 hypothetical protein MCOR17_000835 [Pyricularia oryzae]KAI6512337.1 hypothetical protein MCOR13_000137 [Pyricularia oryzae]KAI6558178.1 hypothetical protein MCOR04_010021 [Pyricularia oryzae]
MEEASHLGHVFCAVPRHARQDLLCNSHFRKVDVYDDVHDYVTDCDATNTYTREVGSARNKPGERQTISKGETHFRPVNMVTPLSAVSWPRPSINPYTRALGHSGSGSGSGLLLGSLGNLEDCIVTR